MTSQVRFRGAPPDGMLMVAVICVGVTFVTVAVGTGPLPFCKVTVAPAAKFVPVMITGLTDVPALPEFGTMLLIVGGPDVAVVTFTVACKLLLAVFVSPATVLALAVKVWLPAAVGVQLKFKS